MQVRREAVNNKDQEEKNSNITGLWRDLWPGAPVQGAGDARHLLPDLWCELLPGAPVR